MITDGWAGYSGLEKIGYVHDRRSQRAARACGEDPGALLPAVHRVVSLAKRWLLGTHQGSVEPAHLASYLNEFVFRFNRRRSRSRGMVFYRVLELAVAHDPVRYQDLIATRRPRAVRPTPAPPTRPCCAWCARSGTGTGNWARNTMITLEHDHLVFRFPDVHAEARCAIELQRTLRIPDDDRDDWERQDEKGPRGHVKRDPLITREQRSPGDDRRGATRSSRRLSQEDAEVIRMSQWAEVRLLPPTIRRGSGA